MIKNFVVKQFSAFLDILFVICAVMVAIFGLITMATGGLKGVFAGLLTIVIGFVYLIICFGVIYLLVDIRDLVKAQTEMRPFE